MILKAMFTQPRMTPQFAILKPVYRPGFCLISFFAMFPVIIAAIAPKSGTIK